MAIKTSDPTRSAYSSSIEAATAIAMKYHRWHLHRPLRLHLSLTYHSIRLSCSSADCLVVTTYSDIIRQHRLHRRRASIRPQRTRRLDRPPNAPVHRLLLVLAFIVSIACDRHVRTERKRRWTIPSQPIRSISPRIRRIHYHLDTKSNRLAMSQIAWIVFARTSLKPFLPSQQKMPIKLADRHIRKWSITTALTIEDRTYH